MDAHVTIRSRKSDSLGQSRRTGPACRHVLGNTVKLQRIALQFGGAFQQQTTRYSGYDD